LKYPIYGVYSWIYEFVICALVIADCEYFVNFYDKLRVIDPPHSSGNYIGF